MQSPPQADVPGRLPESLDLNVGNELCSLRSSFSFLTATHSVLQKTGSLWYLNSKHPISVHLDALKARESCAVLSLVSPQTRLSAKLALHHLPHHAPCHIMKAFRLFYP